MVRGNTVVCCPQVRVNKWLKELERMFYGSCESYEKVRHALLRLLNIQDDASDCSTRIVCSTLCRCIHSLSGAWLSHARAIDTQQIHMCRR